MRYTFFSLFCLSAAMVFVNCQQNKKTESRPAVIGEIHTQKMDGAGCNLPDSLRVNCATVDLFYPEVKEGSEALKKSVASWASAYLVGILAPETDSLKALSMPVSIAVDSFIRLHHEWTKENADSPMSYYTAESRDTVLLNDGKYLTLQIESYTFTGGAHGSPIATVATFDAQTGHQLTWTDIVTDTAAMKALAEKKFRAERADIFQSNGPDDPGFQFDDVFQFKLSDNVGLTDKGVYCYYVHYEVTPYVMGATTFVIPFEELGALRKK